MNALNELARPCLTSFCARTTTSVGMVRAIFAFVILLSYSGDVDGQHERDAIVEQLPLASEINDGDDRSAIARAKRATLYELVRDNLETFVVVHDVDAPIGWQSTL